MSGASAGDRGRRARAYQAIGRFVFRTPLLPIDSLAQWSASGRDVAEARAALSQLLSDPVIAEALFVASPELAGQLDEWRAQPESPAGVGIERALVRYLARMATRSTPFGLFSGVSVGQLGETTRIELPARSANLRHTRLDGDYLFVRRQSTAERGEIVVAMIEGEATVKRYYPEGDRIRFQPANSNMQPIIVRKSDFRSVDIIGIVVGVYRKL